MKNNKDNYNWYKKNDIENRYLSKIYDGNIIIYFIYKTFNRIGSLGENSKILLNEIKKDKILFEVVLEEKYESLQIVGHTRWASVGHVNQKNIHPLINVNKSTNQIPTILSFVNGDIYNSRDIYENINWKDNVDYNYNNENDSIALSYLFSEKDSLKNKKIFKSNINKIIGSITGIMLSDENSDKITL